jgi:hypothetical protein
MERDRLNFFSPFENAPPNHENQLTRALLVVLRMSPIAHAVWLRLIAPDRELQRLPGAKLDTQRRAIRQAGESDEQAELVSVYLAPEEPLSGGGVVTAKDRAQVLDAIIDYGGELLVVVENKVAEADDWQARNLNTSGARVTIAPGQEVIVVLWRDVLEAFVSLRERQLVSGAEAAVLDDFLTYTEDHFPALGPFRTLALCRGNEFRQTRRLRQVLGEAAEAEAMASLYGPYVPTPAGRVIGANAYLKVRNENEIELALYPADTLTQARGFYSSRPAIEGLRDLAARDGWHAGPNFHFGHYERGFCWTCNRVDLDRYLGLWSDRIDDEGAVERARWDDYWTWLESEQIACPQDRAEFDRHFTNSNRSSAVPRPGLWLSRRWSVDEAEQLDSRGVLAAQVRESLDEALVAMGEPGIADATGASSGQVPSTR